MTTREYIVTLHRTEDLQSFYEDIETEGGNLYIPNRAVKVLNRRPTSRNTHYMLTDSEADQVRNDPRVLAVELSPEELGISPTPLYVQSSANWDKGSSVATSHRNWGLYRCTLEQNIPNWGEFQTSALLSSSGIRSVSGTINITASGKHVDVIVVDGHIDPTHPEFAVNPDGTGGSRVIQFNWFSLNPLVTGQAASTYVYPPYVDSSVAGRTSNNDHGAHVAGTICGNSQGWARDANIYNLDPYSTNPNFISSTLIFDYIRTFHATKPINPVTGRKNPTIVNNSWGFFDSTTIERISHVRYRGQQINPPTNSTFSESTLRLLYGIMSLSLIPRRITAIDADIEDCIDNGIIFVGAAGNNSPAPGFKIDITEGLDYSNNIFSFLDGRTYFYHRGSTPGSSGKSICVGAVNRNVDESKAGFSYTGPRVDVYAPGEAIVSSINSNVPVNTYDFRNEFKYISKFNGTSMSAPQVSGVLACLLEIYPNWNQDKIIEYMHKIFKIGVMSDSGSSSYTNSTSLQGSANRYLFYKNEREKDGLVLPKTKTGLRPLSGQLYPRPRIYSFGPNRAA
jgi:subtilisin family serine protease